MTNKYMFLTILSLGLLLSQAANAQTYCLKYSLIKNNSFIDIRVGLIAEGKAFRLGAGNLQLRFNKTGLANPMLLSDVLTLNGTYKGITVTQPVLPRFQETNDGLVSLNFDFTGEKGMGLPISTLGTDIAVIRFQKGKKGFSPNLRPYNTSTMGTIVYDDDNTNPLLLKTMKECPFFDTEMLSNYDRNFDKTDSGLNVGTSAFENRAKLQVYPSILTDFSGFLTVEKLSKDGENPQDFQVINIFGQPVISGKIVERLELDVVRLPLGTYIIKVGEEQVKFMKQ